MGGKCKKCGYERTVSDNCSEEECPNCGALYAKVEAYLKKLKLFKEQYLEKSFQECKVALRNSETSADEKKILEKILEIKKKEIETKIAQAHEQEAQENLKEAQSTGDYSLLQPHELQILTKDIILTTETSPVDIQIAERLEIITAECVYGMNFFRDFFAAITDIVGGRSEASQKVLRDARRTCLLELKREALLVGADAVIGVRLDYNEMTGGGKTGMLFLVASGTAIKLKPPQPNASLGA